MPIPSGLAAQIGFAAETTWATRATPTRFLEFNSESLKLQVERIESKALRTGNRVLRSDRWAANKKGVAGGVEFEVQNKGFGLLFKHMLGAVVISTPGGATATRDHTHTLADPLGLGLTVQVGRPDVGGTVRPFDYTGCKVTDWEITNAIDGLLMLSLTLDGYDEDTAQSLAVASYPASTELLSYVGGTITIAGSDYDLLDFSLRGSNGLKTDRHFISAETRKKEQLAAAMVELGGSMSSEFVDLTAYNRFVNGTMAQVVAKWEGSTIEGAFKYHVEVTLPKVRFDGETPNVGGPDVLTQPLPFKAVYDGSAEPITLVYRTTDTTS